MPDVSLDSSSFISHCRKHHANLVRVLLGPCKQKTCPTGDQEPNCADKSCSGTDDKCTTGDNKDCKCNTEKPECPTGDSELLCSACGGRDREKKCKGVRHSILEMPAE